MDCWWEQCFRQYTSMISLNCIYIICNIYEPTCIKYIYCLFCIFFYSSLFVCLFFALLLFFCYHCLFGGSFLLCIHGVILWKANNRKYQRKKNKNNVFCGGKNKICWFRIISQSIFQQSLSVSISYNSEIKIHWISFVKPQLKANKSKNTILALQSVSNKYILYTWVHICYKLCIYNWERS
jgi:hypothetical protein